MRTYITGILTLCLVTVNRACLAILLQAIMITNANGELEDMEIISLSVRELSLTEVAKDGCYSTMIVINTTVVFVKHTSCYRNSGL